MFFAHVLFVCFSYRSCFFWSSIYHLIFYRLFLLVFLHGFRSWSLSFVWSLHNIRFPHFSVGTILHLIERCHNSYLPRAQFCFLEPSSPSSHCHITNNHETEPNQTEKSRDVSSRTKTCRAEPRRVEPHRDVSSRAETCRALSRVQAQAEHYPDPERRTVPELDPSRAPNPEPRFDEQSPRQGGVPSSNFEPRSELSFKPCLVNHRAASSKYAGAQGLR